MKYIALFVLFIMASCGNKETILLPKSDKTIKKNVVDHSPIYIFFRNRDKDTIAEVNRKNSIISTNWILNIDKRLPLRLVIPAVIKLQVKKREEKAHKNEAAQNYYSYADSIGRNLAFLPFTEVYYKIEQPKDYLTFINFKKKGLIVFKNKVLAINELQQLLNNSKKSINEKPNFSFDRNMSFGEYIQIKVLLEKLKTKPDSISKIHQQEYIY